jgi:DNA end-binding protein Ku
VAPFPTRARNDRLRILRRFDDRESGYVWGNAVRAGQEVSAVKMIWKGAVSFGLITIPVRLYPAVQEKTVAFHQLHDRDGGRIFYTRTCSLCGEEVPYDHVVRGYEYEKGRYVALSDQDLLAVRARSSRTIDLIQFVDLASVDPVYFQKPYYLEPEEVGLKAYQLLRQAMEAAGKVAVGKLALHAKEHLVSIRPYRELLVLETMNWPDEIREAGFPVLAQEPGVRPRELVMAKTLVESLSAEWRPEDLRDEYRDALLALIAEKVAGLPVEVEEEPAPAAGRRGEVVDFMAALQASIAAAKARTAGGGAG